LIAASLNLPCDGSTPAAALATEQRLGFVLEPLLLRGGAVMVQGSYRDAVTCLRQGLEAQRTNQTRPLGFALLAEAMVRQTEHGAALATARDGLKAQEESGHRLWDAELHRLEGIALSGLNRLEEGQHALEEALRIARKRQAKSYELRAGTALARLWSEQGQRTQARDLLAPIYGWFTEGFDTADLKEAKALLEELA